VEENLEMLLRSVYPPTTPRRFADPRVVERLSKWTSLHPVSALYSSLMERARRINSDPFRGVVIFQREAVGRTLFLLSLPLSSSRWGEHVENKERQTTERKTY